MSNVVAFPSVAAVQQHLPFLSPELITAYLAQHPDRLASIRAKLGYASQAAMLLHQLLDEINAEIGV